MDITTLAVVVKSDGVAETTEKLNKLAEASQKASDATTKLASNSSKASGEITKGMQEGVAKGSEAVVAEIDKYQKKIEQNQDTWLYKNRIATEKEYQDKVSMYTKLFAQKDAQDTAASQRAIAQAQMEANSLNKAFDKRVKDRMAAEQTMYRAIEKSKQDEIEATRKALDKQLALEVAYEKASLASKIRMAQEAQVWASKGVDPVSKVGAAAAAADIGKLSEALRVQQKEAKEAAHSADGFSLSTAAAKREVLVLAHELSQGQYKRFGGSLLVLAEQTNMSGMVIAAATSPITYFGLAVGLAAVEAYKGAMAFKEMKQSIADTGNFAGQSAENMWSMSNSLGQVYRSVHDAQEAFTSLNATGKFTSATLYQAADAALAIARNTGQSIEDITKELSKVMDNALKFADDYQTAHHTMSASDRERIKQLQEVGNTEAAALEILKLIRDQSNKTAEEAEKNIGILKMAFLGWKMAINDVATALDNIGKSSISEDMSKRVLEASNNFNSAIEQQAAAKIRLDNANKTGNRESIQMAQDAADRAKKVVDYYKEQVKSVNALSNAKQKAADEETARGRSGDLSKAIDEYKTSNISEMSRKDRAAELTRRENEAFNKIKADAEKILGSVNIDDILYGRKTLNLDKLTKDQQLNLKGIEEAFQLHKNKLQKIEEDSNRGDSKGIDDRYRAKLSVIEGQIQEAKAQLKQVELDNEAAFTKGEIGKYELLQKNLEAEKKYYADEIKLRQDAYKVARPEDRTAKAQDLINAEAQARNKGREAEIKADLEASKFLAEQKAQSNADEVKALRDQGEYVKAYYKQQEIDGKASLDKMQANVMFAKSQVEANFTSGGDQLAKWVERLSVAQTALDSAQSRSTAELNKAVGQELGSQADAAYQTLRTLVEKVKGDIAKGNILDVLVGDKETVNDIISVRIPAAQAALDKFRQHSSGSGGSAMEVAAAEKLASQVQKINKDMKQSLLDLNTKPIELMASKFAEMANATKDMGEGWKKATDALSGFSSAFKDLAKAKEEDDKLTGSGQATRIGAYGQMASAAKGFFSESSAGYKTLDGLAKIAHVAQMGMLVAENGMLAVRAVLSALGTPVIGFAAGAAMAAAVAALGFAVGGGFNSSGDTSKDAANMQKMQGTGTVVGDVNAKSESISKSLELLSKTSDKLFNVNIEMLSNLKGINQSISGLSNAIAKSLGITTGSNLNIQEGTLSTTGILGKMVGAGSGGLGGFVLGNMLLPGLGGIIGAALGGVLGSLLGGLFGKTTQTITDSGLAIGGLLSKIKEGKGEGVAQYANIKTETSSWFGLSKSSSDSQNMYPIDKQVAATVGQIFTGMDKALRSAAMALYGTSDEVGKALDNLTIELSFVSLKGLSGQALQDAVKTVISKAFDQMAMATFPQLEKFAKNGEGLAETVTRLVQEFTTVNSVMKALGGRILGFGDAGIAAADNLVEAAGGLDKFTSQAEYFIQNFLSEQDQVSIAVGAVNGQLKSLGLGFLKTNDQFADYVRSLDLSTKAGQEQYTALMALAPAFDTVTKYITKITDAVTSAKSGLESDKQKVLSSIEGYDAVAYAQEQVNKAQKAYLAATDPQEQVDATNKLRAALMAKYDAEIAASNKAQAAIKEKYDAEMTVLNTLKTQMEALASFKVSIGEARQSILSKQAGYDAVAYQKSVLDAATKEMNAATNPDAQLKAAQKVKDAIMAKYDAESAAIEANKTALQSQVDAQNAAGKAAVDAQNKLNAAYRSIGDYAKSLLTSTESPLSQFAQMSYNQGSYNDLVKALRAGDVSNSGQYQTLAGNVLKSAMDTATTAVDYARSFYTVLGTSQELGAKAGIDQTWQDVSIANQGVSIGLQQNLDKIQTDALNSLDELNKLTDKWQSDLGSQAAASQKRLDEYNAQTKVWQDVTLTAQYGVLTALESLNDNLSNILERVVAQLGGTPTNKPVTPVGTVSAIGNMPEQQIVAGSVPALNWTAPANNEPSAIDAVNEVANNVAGLQADMKVALTQVALNTSATANWLKRWNGDGMPETRTWVNS